MVRLFNCHFCQYLDGFVKNSDNTHLARGGGF